MRQWDLRPAASLLGPFALVLLAAQSASATAPLRPKIATCQALDYEGDATGDQIPQKGAGNIPLRRSVLVRFDLFARTAGDASDVAARTAVLAATHRIEICLAKDGAITCPGTGSTGRPWVLFDDSTTPPFVAPLGVDAKAELETRILAPGVSSRSFSYEILTADGKPPPEVDWADVANAGTFLVLAVNRGSADADATTYVAQDGVLVAPELIAQGGFCAVPQPLAKSTDGRFRVFGTDPASTPFSLPPSPKTCASGPPCAAIDPCVAGDKATGPADPLWGNTCVSPANAAFIAQRTSELQLWQEKVVLKTTPLLPPAWANSGLATGDCPDPAPGGYCPSFVFLAPIDAGGYGTASGFRLRSQNIPQAPYVTLSYGGGDETNIAGHEYAHKLQDAFRRQAALQGIADDATKGALHQGGVSEGVPASLQVHACIEGYGGATGKQCVSPGMLAGVYVADTYRWLDAPATNIFAITYTSSLFWRYAYEQFAAPLGGAAHPGGKASSVPSDHNLPLGDHDRRSDEGLDLLGPILQRMASNPLDPAFTKTFDGVLVEYLGRNLENVVLDFHTAALLKDYKETDQRWWFEWVGDFNAGVPTNPVVAGAPVDPLRLGQRKPFAVPADLKASSPTPPDFLNRARRTLDDHVACPGCASATRTYLGVGQGAAALAPEYLEPFGAAYLALSPSAALAAAGKPLTIQIAPKLGAPLHLRVFRTDASGNVTTACPLAANKPLPAPQDECAASPDGSYAINVGLPGTDEILVVVSNTKDASASFDWRAGEILPSVRLQDPTQAHPVSIGNVGAKLPFIGQFTVKDEQNAPVQLAAGDVTLDVGACTGIPFQMAQVGAGTYWTTAGVPDDCYPAPPALLDFVVHAKVGGTSYSSTEGEKALRVEAAPPKTVMQVVLDRSGSMATDAQGAKLVAAKLAANLVVQNLLDTDEFGLVTFNNDAQSPLTLLGAAGAGGGPSGCPATTGGPILPLTPTAAVPDPRGAIKAEIDKLEAVGWTSIGDGALEAQSNFLQSGYDVVTPGAPRLGMLVISDGLSNAGHPPERFTLFAPVSLPDGPDLPPGSTDPDPCDSLPGSWTGGSTGILYLTGRQNNGLVPKLLWPTVSTLALGQDANGNPLMTMADVGKGAFTFADAVTSSEQLAAQQISLSNSMLQGLHKITGHQRVQAGFIDPEVSVLNVEPMTREIVVSLVSAGTNVSAVTLVPPGGAPLTPIHATPSTAVFRVPSPAAGTWSLTGTSPPPGGTSAQAPFMEVSAATPILLVGRADVFDVAPTPPAGTGGGAYDDGRYVMKPVRLVAALTDGGPITGASVTATVRSPSSVETVVVLHDDGLHGDGQAGDGFYGGVYAKTQVPGTYAVSLRAAGTSSVTGAEFRREQELAFALAHGPDTDGDAMPDWWESLQGTQVTVPDSNDDPDGDGLINVDELRAGTWAHAADSDNGGEADGSEVLSGRDPLDGSDDAVHLPGVHVLAGAGKVLIATGVGTAANATVSIRVAASRDGVYRELPILRRRTAEGARGLSAAEETYPLDPDGSWAPACRSLPEDPYVFACASVDGAQGCYQVRVTTHASSTWSAPVCVTSSQDPHPPRIEAFSLESGEPFTRTRAVTFRLDATDVPREPGVDTLLVDPEARASGVTEALIATTADFAGASWRPIGDLAPLWLPDAKTTTVYAKVRDAAGNESDPRFTVIRLIEKTGVDRALHLEERALDQMHKGQWAAARTSITASLIPLKESIVRVKARLAKAGKPDATDVKLLEELLEILALKVEAGALSRPATGALARQALRRALAEERELASLAERNGREL